jgi:hypothetical protein
MDSHIRFMEQAFNKTYLNMEYKCVMTREIERIIKSLKPKVHMGMTRYPQKF